MKESERLKIELDALVKEANNLHDERDLLEDRIEVISERLRELNGALGDYGNIAKAQDAYVNALRLEEDEIKPLPVWTNAPRDSDKKRVISKITPKRIYLKTQGVGGEDYYDKETGITFNSSFYGVLDVPATVTVWAEWLKSNKEIAK